jgi:hypothetical protein
MMMMTTMMSISIFDWDEAQSIAYQPGNGLRFGQLFIFNHRSGSIAFLVEEFCDN